MPITVARLVQECTPFREATVLRWLQQQGLPASFPTLTDIPAALLVTFLVRGVGATKADIMATAAQLEAKDACKADSVGLQSPRAHRAVRLPMALPFDERAYHDPSSPFYHIGDMHREYKGWWHCPCWKCN
jgi:hypothetical protein